MPVSGLRKPFAVLCGPLSFPFILSLFPIFLKTYYFHATSQPSSACLLTYNRFYLEVYYYVLIVLFGSPNYQLIKVFHFFFSFLSPFIRTSSANLLKNRISSSVSQFIYIFIVNDKLSIPYVKIKKLNIL